MQARERGKKKHNARKGEEKREGDKRTPTRSRHVGEKKLG